LLEQDRKLVQNRPTAQEDAVGMVVLDKIIARLEQSPEGVIDGPRLRAYLANMLRGRMLGHASKLACHSRLEGALTRFEQSVDKGTPATWEHFYHALEEELGERKDQHFYEVREPVDEDLELPAVTFQSAIPAAMMSWIGQPGSASNLVTAIRQRRYLPNAHVGWQWRPVWLTPLKGEVKALIEQARKRASPDLAKHARDLIANSGWHADAAIVAFIPRSDPEPAISCSWQVRRCESAASGRFHGSRGLHT